MSAATATRLTRLDGEPRSAPAPPAHARDGTQLPVPHGLIRRQRPVVVTCCGDMPARKRPTPDGTVTARRVLLDGDRLNDRQSADQIGGSASPPERGAGRRCRPVWSRGLLSGSCALGGFELGAC